MADESKNPASLKMVEEFFEDIVNHYITDPEKKNDARFKLRIFEAFFEDLYSRTNRLEYKFKEIQKTEDRVQHVLEKVDGLADVDIGDLKDDLDTLTNKVDDLSADCRDIKSDIDSNNEKVNDLDRKVSGIDTEVYNHGVDIRSIKDNLGY